MVRQIDDLDEKAMQDAANAIVIRDSELVQFLPEFGQDMAIWKSSVNKQPNLLAFWIGTRGDGHPRLGAYRICEPTGIPNGRKALEMKRAWVHAELRGRRLSSYLMRVMALKEEAALLADRDGLTTPGYLVWEKMSGCRRMYWDQQSMCMVDSTGVPQAELFGKLPASSRWALVLELDATRPFPPIAKP